MSIKAEDYYNQVVYIESLRYRAHWLDAHHSGEARFTESPEPDVINNIWAKWLMKKGPGSTILLESVRYRNRYLDAHHSGNCKVTYSAYPYDDDWALWYMEDNGDGSVSFRSKRYPDKRLDSHHSGGAHVTSGSGDWSRFRVYQPTAQERKVLLFSRDNTHGSTPVEVEYEEKIGISKTESTTTTISAEMSMEIQDIFVSAKMSFSAAWSTSTSTTWNIETTSKVTVTVPPGTKKEVYQLTGFYGEGQNEYAVRSNHLYFEG